jgi:hypothetical protein
MSVLTEPLHEVELRRGLIDQTGARHRHAALRPLTGWQEAALGTASQRPEARSIHALLAACIARLGGYVEVNTTHTAALSRGDRERLALGLRSMTFGDQLLLSPRCPNPACRELADLDLSIRDILDTVSEAEPEWFEVETPEGLARLRPPTGLDDEACEAYAGSHQERAVWLWCRLVAGVGDRSPLQPQDWHTLQPATRHAIALALADTQSAPDLSFVSRCPSCRAWMELELDPFVLLGREFRLGVDRLLVEAHCLAFHYGWSEDQIFALPRSRRWRYLELLRNQLEGRPLTDLWR